MKRWLSALRQAYLTVDPRSLGAFRIGLGLLLLSDLLRRYQELDLWYTNSGLLPNHTLLWRPTAGHMFSFFFTASSAAEARFGFLLCALAYLLLLVGYRTRLAQALALVCRVSLNSRLAVLENGGDMVINLLCLFSLALPLGRRFSLDALLNANRPTAAADDARRPVVSLAMLGMTLQFAAIYFFNAVSKQGKAWIDGTAVHYALHQDKLVTSLGVWMREHLPIEAIQTLTWGTLAIEWLGFALIISPVCVVRARLLAVCLLPPLHLAFALGLHVGSFSPAMMAFYPLLLRHEHWDALARRFQGHAMLARAARLRAHLATWCARLLPPPPPPPSAPSRARHWLSEALVCVLMLAITTEILNDNASVPHALRVSQPAWAKAVIEYPRILQGWRMFAPDPSTQDGMIQVDATTAEGTHVDPYNAVTGRHAFPHGDTVPTRTDQSHFSVMYSDRIGQVRYAAYRQAFHEWLLAYPERTGRESDCLLAFDVYLVTDRSPEPGTNTAPQPQLRQKFMEYRAPRDSDCQRLRASGAPHVATRPVPRPASMDW